ncbi:GTPase RsgA [Blastococcus mobilis]|uniref:Ribosome biogenesis GTPase n=1 Tax=Blastococcus mobilis TaxID=1938746 RepID=A0A238VPS7_9ACTN|nr:GTPase RsgA [Blastococcus mobilis]SNR36236.1 ribosome biogenesis GTPase [Blastococcus mobilis]
MTDLSALGWTTDRVVELPPGCTPARVTRVDRARLSVLSGQGEQRVVPAAALYGVEPGGPAVGGWVALRGELAVAVLPRRSAFVRTIAGRTSEAQVVAANLDTVLVVDALTGDARMRRVERYLAVAGSSGATPVVVLTRRTSAPTWEPPSRRCGRTPSASTSCPSARSPGWAWGSSVHCSGRDGPRRWSAPPGSGSLANALAGRIVAGTREIREDGRGRHTTTARELRLLPGGGLLVDTPGMRELALYDDAEGVETAYADVSELATGCRFRDCAHGGEPGCAVAAAIDDGRLDPARFIAWRKLQAEAHRRLLRVDARARAEERARLRTLHRALREQPNRMR